MDLIPERQTKMEAQAEVVVRVAWLTSFRLLSQWVFVAGSRETNRRGPLSPPTAKSPWAAVRVLTVDDRS
jgi:hypothetical protein